MRSVTFLFLTIFLISSCFAQCNSGQIDINSASLTDLDKLTGIGPAYAQAIIDGRVYSTLDDLDRVKGIGPKTLEKIKSQGLACTASGTLIKPDSSSNIEPPIVSPQVEELEEETYSIPKVTAKVVEEINLEQQEVPQEEPTESIINLNSDVKNVKEKVIYESRSEKIRQYAIYVFGAFLLVIVAFLLLDKYGRTKDYSSDDY